MREQTPMIRALRSESMENAEAGPDRLALVFIVRYFLDILPTAEQQQYHNPGSTVFTVRPGYPNFSSKRVLILSLQSKRIQSVLLQTSTGRLSIRRRIFIYY